LTKEIKLVVFDIAGTTVKDNGEIAVSFQKAMENFGYSVPVEKINPLMGYKKTEAIKMMLQVYQEDITVMSEEYINRIHTRFIELMVEYYAKTKDLQPLSNAENIFAYLKERNIKIGLNTGFTTDITNVIIERLGWLQNKVVNYVVSSNEVIAGRPHPFMIQKMMQQAGIDDPKNVVKIGDTEVDINEGKNTGCLYSIGVTTGAFTRQQLEPHEPSFIIDDLGELVSIF
jgi:phosphonatase-like hydrolase